MLQMAFNSCDANPVHYSQGCLLLQTELIGGNTPLLAVAVK